ncbi:MAG: regulatory protein RecX [Gammaproteobacteria bacterium]|nr:regulatory protein RecX [Gammaproteobacteria bacterium]
MSVSLSSIRLTAMNILATREHSKKELSDKLLKKYDQNNDDEINSLITLLLEQLIADNLLNEHRFVETFIRSKRRKGVGPVKIRHELVQKGIESELISDYLSDISNEEWLDEIKNQRIKKYGKELPSDNKDIIKQSRFLYQRGYPVDLINCVLYSKDIY